MNKRWTTTLAVSLITISLAACGNNQDNNQPQDPMDPNEDMELNEPNNDNVEGQGNGHTNMHDNMDDMHMGVSDEVADRVMELEGVNHATAIVVNNHAYIAVEMDDAAHDVSDDLKAQISDKAKETDEEIENVYVSANPDFAERLEGYGERIQNGDPIEGFADEFMESVNRIFPTRE
ncbi:YhcN/YlaJ family sporulation lipoprotein [Shouchella patagoniensis]|uniref:YhcN/YlaJ family sporulation lipoprotein n=1 Tax=Shouchella patagoniensis TaxID=228576 RepID=UPI00099559DA|nr:YhcN/YlaJ family sporulation lipoprotein [Shouchella patagoniensis]